MTVAEYAESRKKSREAVYQQITRKTNAALLDGHITKEKRGNRWVRVLDDVAVAVLDEASRHHPVIVEQAAKDERIAVLENKVEILTAELLATQKRLIEKSDRVEELQQKMIGDKGRRRMADIWREKKMGKAGRQDD